MKTSVEELQDPQQPVTDDSFPMSRCENTRTSSEICDDTVDVEHQSSSSQTPMLERHITCEQEGNQTGYLIINESYQNILTEKFDCLLHFCSLLYCVLQLILQHFCSLFRPV